MFKGICQFNAAKSRLDRSQIHSSQQRIFCGAPVSSLALGTYLGAMNFPTDQKVSKACLDANQQGISFFDTAINYRGQRSETAIGEALRQGILKSQLHREEIFISTKGGFVPFDGEATEDMTGLFRKNYVDTGIAKAEDLIAGCHCMTPAYLNNQIERSRKNLGIETIDLFYIHNPETQLEEFPARIFYKRLTDAFERLEQSRTEGKIKYYGLATWDAFREPPEGQLHISLKKVHEIAKLVGGDNHGFKAIQMPFNFAMLEAGWYRSQDNGVTTLKMAQDLGIDVAVSAPLYQGRLAEGLPPFITKHFPNELSQSQMALLFATSVPGIKAVMTGMKEPKHILENCKILKMPTLSVDQVNQIVQSIMQKH